jgi:hypothetical protein
VVNARPGAVLMAGFISALIGAGFALEEETTQMEKPKRSYYLPNKLVSAFDRECSKSGYVKEKVVAAAMLSFLDSDPELRSNMFEKLDVFLKGRKQR